MFCEDVCLGRSFVTNSLRDLSNSLSVKVVDKVNGSQKLLMLTGFAQESNECQFKKCLQDRISDVASWHWVLKDLSNRLEESINALKYEHNALSVVVQRIQEEIDDQCKEGSRPGAICPLTDIVEDAIIQEFNFLRDQKENFEQLILDLEKQITMLEKSKLKIETDVINKQEALNIEEMCSNKDYLNTSIVVLKKARKKGSPVGIWVKRCAALKRTGLNALCNAVITRQQVRSARGQLSVAAQAYATRVDAALRRRLHANRLKLQDLSWQREEALRDYNSLQEELTLAERKVIETMNHERIVTARLAERMQRPGRELTKDEVNRKLRDEQNQIRRFVKDLRHNVEDIIVLQNNIKKAVTNIDCCAQDLMQVVNLDEQRILRRQGEQSRTDTSTDTITSIPTNNMSAPSRSHSVALPSAQLTVIQEENEEEDDYPFNF